MARDLTVPGCLLSSAHGFEGVKSQTVITAKRGGPFTWVLSKYIERKMQTSFRGVWVRGELPKLNDAGLLLYANHSNFWDGFVALTVAQHAGWKFFCAMEDVNLRRYAFLSRLGAFSIQKDDAKAALKSLRYAAGLLEKPNHAVLIFPEGELHAFSQTPHPLQRGIEVLARLGKVPCLPMAFRYVFAEHEYPDVMVDIGQPHAPAPLSTFSDNLHSLTQKLFEVRGFEGFRQIVAGRAGVNEKWDAARGLDAPSATVRKPG